MLRICSLNMNGIRAAYRKGFADWLAEHQPDLICLQEVRIQDKDLKDPMRHPDGYTGYFNLAQKAGYSGVGLYLKTEPQRVLLGMECDEFDPEGRIIRADYEHLTVISAYLPSGTSGDERQEAKYRFLERFEHWLQVYMDDHKKTGRDYVICGDWNIAHHEIDLKNWRGNQKNSGFLPEERAWMTKILSEMGWVDVYRALYPEHTHECYTWWSNRGQAWANNTGWRIDYQIATPGIAATAKEAWVYKEHRYSDHAPLVVDYDLPLR